MSQGATASVAARVMLQLTPDVAAATDAVRICRSGWLGDRPRTASAAAIGIEHWGEANRAAADAVAPDYELPRPTDP